MGDYMSSTSWDRKGHSSRDGGLYIGEGHYEGKWKDEREQRGTIFEGAGNIFLEQRKEEECKKLYAAGWQKNEEEKSRKNWL